MPDDKSDCPKCGFPGHLPHDETQCEWRQANARDDNYRPWSPQAAEKWEPRRA
ncbi:MAG: hypothetical protein JWL76_2008 [Thermoleophilia bacterium]|nr:hypothetical protein [Thermoleophilia bacterium]